MIYQPNIDAYMEFAHFMIMFWFENGINSIYAVRILVCHTVTGLKKHGAEWHQSVTKI